MRTLLLTATLAALLVPQALAQAADLEAGKKIYVENCQKCHGNKAQGGIGERLAGDAAYWDADVFKRAVLEGIDDEGKKLKTVMPHWGKTGLNTPKGYMLTDADLANIEAYLQTFGPKTTSK